MNNTVTMDLDKYNKLFVEHIDAFERLDESLSEIEELKEEIIRLKEVQYKAMIYKYNLKLDNTNVNMNNLWYKDLLGNDFNVIQKDLDEIIIRYKNEKEQEKGDGCE